MAAMQQMELAMETSEDFELKTALGQKCGAYQHATHDWSTCKGLRNSHSYLSAS